MCVCNDQLIYELSDVFLKAVTAIAEVSLQPPAELEYLLTIKN